MAKETKWHDVRLLSFDLQTVEFSYAHVRVILSFLEESFLTPESPGLHSLYILSRSTIPHWW